MPGFSLCVYCGSNEGTQPSYKTAAQELGTAIGAHGWRLVYGAGNAGLMGQVARAAITAGAETFGAIPEHLLDSEMAKTDLTSLVITETMHERKKIMMMNSDAIILLPGGVGSLDEFFEALTWAQLGLHEKPIILLDIDGYWSSLIAMLYHMIEHGFANASLMMLFTVAGTVEDAISILEPSAP